jgi:outer membrane protein assembly factor BamB
VPIATMLVLAMLSGASRVTGNDQGDGPSWPEFHGTGRTNVSPEKGLLKRWPDGGPTLLWKYSKCGEGYSGVTIAQDMIYTAGDFDEAETLVTLDLDGNLLWQAPNGDAWRRSSPGSRATPTYNDGVLYHMNPTGRLAAFDARTGQSRWAVDLRSRFQARYGIWALAEHVIVDGDRVLCMPGGPEARVVALDKRTGKTLWTNAEIEYSAAYCSPVVVTHQGIRQLITMTQRSVVGVDVQTGRLVWSAPFAPRSPQNALTPVFQDGYVFIACGHSSGGRLLKIDSESRTASTVWHREDLDDCHSGAFLLDGKLYGCGCRAGGKSLYCVDFLTGETVQMDRSFDKVGITCADGMIYCLNHRGTVSLLAITPSGFEMVSQFELPREPPNTYLAHPVVCGKRLYLRGGNDLYVFDIRSN